MGSFTLEEWGDVTVNHPDDITREQIEKFDSFKNWIETLKASLKLQKHRTHPLYKNELKLTKVDIKEKFMINYEDGKEKKQRPLFMYLEVVVENRKKEPLTTSSFSAAAPLQSSSFYAHPTRP